MSTWLAATLSFYAAVAAAFGLTALIMLVPWVGLPLAAVLFFLGVPLFYYLALR